MQAARSNYTILFKKKEEKKHFKQKAKQGQEACKQPPAAPKATQLSSHRSRHNLLPRPSLTEGTEALPALQGGCSSWHALGTACHKFAAYLIHAALLLTAKCCCRDSVSGENKNQQKTYTWKWKRNRKWNETRVYNIYYLVILLLLIYNYIHMLLY